MGDVLQIDGSQGEGGGQILRTAVSLAAATRQAVRIGNIRRGREKPGLGAQHLAAVRAAAQICGGELTGDAMGSGEITFRPGPVRAGRYHFEIPTAGSTSLLCQTIIPALALTDGESEVTVTGGTHNPMAPCFEYLRDVYSVLASVANIEAYFELERGGFYPAGGGVMTMMIGGQGDRAGIDPIHLISRGEMRYIEGVSGASTSLSHDIADRQASQVLARIAAAGHRGSVERADIQSQSPGTVVFVRAVFARTVAGFFALGRRGFRAEFVADDAVDQLMEFIDSDGVVDSHAADQLLTLAALCDAQSRFRTQEVTAHLLTNAAVVQQLTGRHVEIDAGVGESGLVTIEAG